MSEYHLIGITNQGTLEQVASTDSREGIDQLAMTWAPQYQRMFLIQPHLNVRELNVILPIEGRVELGKFAPVVAGSEKPDKNPAG